MVSEDKIQNVAKGKTRNRKLQMGQARRNFSF